MTSAKVICDSVSERGDRLSTLEVRLHRFVLAEFNTHRVFSRNSASSRAIPFPKQLKRVDEDPAIPVLWRGEQKGMQGGDEVDDTDSARNIWLRAKESALRDASALAGKGVHKGIVNRLLEPFMWHTIVVTATSWDNFMALRCDKAADDHIRVAAEAMCDALIESTPEYVDHGLWHLPYITDEDREYAAFKRPDRVLGKSSMPWLCKISSARCARVSYLTHDGRRDYEEDLRLYDTLTGNGHSSPMEHVATPMPGNRQHLDVWTQDEKADEPLHLLVPRYGNLMGWHQHRFDVEARRGYRAYA